MKIVSTYNDMKKELLKIKNGNRGSVKIGYINLSQFEILSRTINVIKKSNPEIEISIYQRSLAECQQELLDGKIDISFNMFDYNLRSEHINYEKLTDGQLYAVVPGNHPFRDRTSLLIKDLIDENLLTFERDQAPELFDSVINLYNNNGFSPKFSAKGKNMESIMMLVGIGQGIALMDETAKILESKHTIFIKLDDCRDSYAWYLTSLKKNNNPCISLVVDTIKKEKESFNYSQFNK